MTKTCQNPACGKPLVRRDKERRKDWEKRTTCDRRCYKVLKRVEKWELLQSRTKCEVCGKKLSPTIAKNGKAVAPRTCRSKACMVELRLRTRAQRMEQEETPSGATTWTEPRCVICGSTKVRKAGRRTCEKRACRNEYRDRRAAERAAKKVAAEASERTWKDPAGNVHTLPSNIALREEYKASIKRRIKRGEGVQMIGKVRVYEGPVTKAAA